MANIYLQLPTIIAYYHRNYDPEHQLQNNEPLVFSNYTDHAAILRGGLAVFTNNTKKVAACYSQQQWKNITNGKRTDGTKQVLHRDASVWPTFDEICRIEGYRLSYRSDSYDYLCIQMPVTIRLGDKEIRTNSSFSLTDEAAYVLQDLLVRDFTRALVNWEIGTQDFCIKPERVIRRGQMNTLERFLMHFNIPISKDSKEKQSLRRQLARWLKSARLLEKAYRSNDIEYEDSQDIVVHRNTR